MPFRCFESGLLRRSHCASPMAPAFSAQLRVVRPEKGMHCLSCSAAAESLSKERHIVEIFSAWHLAKICIATFGLVSLALISMLPLRKYQHQNYCAREECQPLFHTASPRPALLNSLRWGPQ